MSQALVKKTWVNLEKTTVFLFLSEGRLSKAMGRAVINFSPPEMGIVHIRACPTALEN